MKVRELIALLNKRDLEMDIIVSITDADSETETRGEVWTVVNGPTYVHLHAKSMPVGSTAEQPDLVNYWNNMIGCQLLKWIPDVPGEPWMKDGKHNPGAVWVMKDGEEVAISESIEDVPIICMDNGMEDIGVRLEAMLTE